MLRAIDIDIVLSGRAGIPVINVVKMNEYCRASSSTVLLHRCIAAPCRRRFHSVASMSGRLCFAARLFRRFWLIRVASRLAVAGVGRFSMKITKELVESRAFLLWGARVNLPRPSSRRPAQAVSDGLDHQPCQSRERRHVLVTAAAIHHAWPWQRADGPGREDGVGRQKAAFLAVLPDGRRAHGMLHCSTITCNSCEYNLSPHAWTQHAFHHEVRLKLKESSCTVP